MGIPQWLSPEESASDTGNVGWIPGLVRSPKEWNGNPLLSSCPGNYGQRSLAGYRPQEGVGHNWVTKQ